METIPYILATAGHVDHGKSAVVRVLTGVDPDRLPEEKARGITIDLGFAHLVLGSPDGQRRFRVGIVDVPGHEDFVKNMVAGVGSIDIALLIVAADDGWMPQTEEHLQILTYLGVTRGVVALTKIDLANDRETDVIDSIRVKLRETPLSDAPIVPTSIVTNRGFDELKRAIAGVLARAPQPRDIGKPRLPIDRVFTLKGVGTVVTGTLSGGTFKRGQNVIVQPRGTSTRIRSVQSHNSDVEVAQPSSRIALNLPDLDTSAIGRGDVITIGELGAPGESIDVALDRSDRVQMRPLKTSTRVQVHHGSAAIPARVQLLESNELATGQRSIARLRLEQPLFALVGDRFILRDWSEQHTLAGGIVLDVHPPRVPDPAMLQRRAAAPSDARMLVETEVARMHAIERSRLLMQSNLDAASIESAIAPTSLVGTLVVDRVWWQTTRGRAAEAIDGFHRASPERPGLPLADLRRVIELSDAMFDALLVDLAGSGFVRDGAVIRRASHRLQLPPRLQVAGERLRGMLAEKPFEPPSRGQLVPDAIAQQALKFLVANHEAVEIGPDVILSAEALQRAIDMIRNHIRGYGPATVSELKSVLNSSRRIVVPLLEKLDRDGITRRDGDRRSLK
jgi:selenocysteine-specific elongation factor